MPVSARPSDAMFRARLPAAALLAASVLSACSVGPAYRRPEIPPPVAWNTAQTTPATWPSADWWRGFGSPQLDALIAQAQHANDDIAAAIARVRQADAQIRISRAALLPSVDADLGASRARTQAQSGGSSSLNNQYSAQLGASYQLDFWGQNRSALAAAKASAAASRYDRATVELTVMADVATDYFLVLGLRERLEVAQANLDSARTILKGLQLSLGAGTANALDVAQQETTVANLDAAIPPLRQQLGQTVDALAILLGKPPEAVSLDHGSLADLARPPVSPGLPSELLARRPDVAEAEAQLIAANADIGVARAAMFPNITLTAQGGYASPQLSDLFNPASKLFSLAAGLTQPIFHGGALRGQLALSQARYDELLADYHKAVIAAFANVEDALIAAQQTAEQERRLQVAADSAGRAYAIAQAQMRAGTIDILTVLNTESALFTARDALVQAELAHLQALVGLFDALGGGWQNTQALAAKVIR